MRKIFWAERRRREEQRSASRREKGEMMDWTWEDNEEWNTVQQNVISQTVVWGALLPFHWDCYYRWISPTKTSIPRVQHFLDFAAIEAGFENPALKADRVSAPMRLLWHRDEGWIGRERTYIFRSRLLLWTFLISADIQISKEKMPLWRCRLTSQMPVVKLINLNTDNLLLLRCFELRKVICDSG